jgi:hypothetical protein
MTSPTATFPVRRGLTAVQVFELQTHRGYLSVSVLRSARHRRRG